MIIKIKIVISELIPETHVVRIVNGFIDRLDTSCLMESYKDGGNSCYNPKMMLKLLVYSYLNNVYSSRKIEQQVRKTKFSHSNRFRLWQRAELRVYVRGESHAIYKI